MSKYIAKAYVSIPDSKTRNEVIEKLNELDYHYDTPPNDIDYIAEIIHIRDGDLFAERIKYFSLTETIKEAIDCNAYTPNGTEEEAVRLFLELVKVRSDVNEGQWYYWLDSVDDVCPLRKWDDNENWSWWRFEVRRATPLEVAEAFRDGRIEL